MRSVRGDCGEWDPLPDPDVVAVVDACIACTAAVFWDPIAMY